ncbi:hypothetical protein [Commensalibacter melissae]|uniref:hypothetical protein n=1 Tax=Commensalibacter melissae TaxID=2070537 RepID=UPI0012D95806|nr:hypothetical protein [Commensalibacter melissae]MUH05389.1 hypothetical protein [Commensalibacter melissae]
MNQVRTSGNQSLQMVIASIPQWIRQFKNQTCHSRYSREGMIDLVISSKPVCIDDKSRREAKEHLDRLINMSSIPLAMETVCKVLSIVNVQVANPYGKNDFSFRVKATYGTFRNYPDCIFNETIAYRLSTISKFFPSANEIKRVLDEEKKKLDDEIENLKSIVNGVFSSGKDSVLEEMERKRVKEAMIREKEEEEYSLRIRAIRERLKPVDNLVTEMDEVVERYFPDDISRRDHDRIIQFLTEKMNEIEDERIRNIFLEKIRLVESAKRQFEIISNAGLIVGVA